MKVLFITNLPSPYRVDFFSELSKHCDLTVFFEGRRSDNLNFNWNDDYISSFNSYFFSELFNEKKFIFSLIKRVIFSKYDKIIISTYSTRTQSMLIVILKILNIGYYFETDGGIIPLKESKLKSAIKFFLISGAKGYFSTGKGSDKYLIKYGAKTNKLLRYTFTSLFRRDIVDKIPNKEQKVNYKKSLDIPYDKIIIGVGQFIQRKGFDILLESCVYFSKNVGVYIIGGTPTKEYLETQKRLNLNNINYLEFLSKEELDKWFLAADLFVLPTREDVWGLVINEAMSKALPVITTNGCLAGQELIIDKECLSPIENSVYLGSIINKVIEDENYLLRLSKNNLKTIKQSTFEVMALDHIKVFNKDEKIS